jgi:hypothetical protein
MSINRDKLRDQSNTRLLSATLANSTEVEKSTLDDGIKNWLGHSIQSGAAKVDEALLRGATADQLTAIRKSFDDHITHLRLEHGLLVKKLDDRYYFSIQ